MRCHCFDKDICVLCQGYKYYNIYCTRCVSVKVCYNCTTAMLESAFINACPVCKLENTEDKKWYKIKFNKQIIVPVKTTGITLDENSETKFEKCCLETHVLCRNIYIFYRYLVLTVGCVMINHAVGMFLIICFSDDDFKITNKDAIYLITVPSVVGILFFSCICFCIKVCFVDLINRRKMLLKKIIIGLLVWHIVVFYGIQILLIHNIDHVDGCYCGSNLFTNTIYMCTKSTLLSYFPILVPSRVLEPSIKNPYTYIQPMNIQFSTMVCEK